MTEYNGWTNKETWLVSLWYMDEIRTYRPNRPEDIEEYVSFIVLEQGDRSYEGLALDFLRMCLQDTNWRELYEHIEEERYDIHRGKRI